MYWKFLIPLDWQWGSSSFNHVGGRRITRDATPIEVAMKLYERDVDDTLIETADREGKEIE